MKSSAGRLATTAVLAAALVLVAGSDAEPGVAGDSLLQTQQLSVLGNMVRVTVANRGDETMTETVRVRAVVKGRVMEASRTVSLAPGESTSVGFEFPATVTGIIEAGVILDDGAPF